jgi:hypothetical protein
VSRSPSPLFHGNWWVAFAKKKQDHHKVRNNNNEKKRAEKCKARQLCSPKKYLLKIYNNIRKKNHFGPLPLLECEKDEVHIKESTSFLNVEEGGTRSRV